MWNLPFVCRLVVLMALPLFGSQLAIGADEEGASNRSAARVAGRSQQRAILHTTDPLDAVLDRVHKKSAILIDVREQSEWDAGHLHGAVFLPLSKLKEGSQDPEFREQLAKLSKDKILYCHCKAGGRVLSAASILKTHGFEVRPLKAGYDTLLEAGFEQASPSVEPAK